MAVTGVRLGGEPAAGGRPRAGARAAAAHARTAAILRSGWLSRGDRNGDGALAVDLSSERVRLAVDVLDE